MEEKKPFVPYTKEQKQEYGKQFSPEQKLSYHKGRRSAYTHMENAARRESVFISENLNKDGAPKPAPKPAQSKAAPPPERSYTKQESKFLKESLTQAKAEQQQAQKAKK